MAGRADELEDIQRKNPLCASVWLGLGSVFSNYRATRAAMPSSSTSSRRDANDYAQRIRKWVPRRLQGLREGRGLSMYRLERKCGVPRQTISRIESGETLPGVYVLAQLARGVGVTLEGLFNGMKEVPKPSRICD